MDLTVEVMLPSRGAADFSTSANPKYRVLAPVAVYWRKDAPVVGMPRTGYIHVNDVPMPQAWADLTADEVMARINARLCAFWSEELGERRLWCGDASLIGAAARNNLRTERQITVGWTAFKNVLRNLVELRALNDQDIE